MAKAGRMREVAHAAGRGRLIIGLSGGIDSAVALGIAVRAVGAHDVTAVRLPSRHTEQVHLDDAAATAAAVGLPDENLLTVSIEPILAGLAEARPDVAGSDIRFGNASARSRMIVIYDLAQALHALVVGTENRTENLLGYFTRFGDAASDIEPITDLYKTEVRAAARVLGLPEAVITKHPTAGLWGGQTDEDELGFTYARCRPGAGGDVRPRDDAGAGRRAGGRRPRRRRPRPRACGRRRAGSTPCRTRSDGLTTPRGAAACQPTPRARAGPRPRAGGRARG